MKTYVGIDYHKAYSYGAIMTEQGDVLKQARFANTPEALAAFLGEYSGPQCAAVLEATRGWPLMHRWLRAEVGRVLLAHPLKVRAIAEASIKTDKVDATTLAHLLRSNWIPQAHVSSEEAQQVRDVLRQRQFVVRVTTMSKNRIHDLLDRHPLQTRGRQGAALFSARGLRWMEGLRLGQPDTAILESLVRVLEQLRQERRHLDGMLAEVGKADGRLQRLMTIPGIGRTLGMVLIAEIDDIGRFASPRQLHAYAGLIPRLRASADKVRRGPLVGACNKWLRWAMVEAAYPAARTDPELRRLYLRVARRKGPNTAKIAVARRLLTIAYRVWKDNRPYRTPKEPSQKTTYKETTCADPILGGPHVGRTGPGSAVGPS